MNLELQATVTQDAAGRILAAIAELVAERDHPTTSDRVADRVDPDGGRAVAGTTPRRSARRRPGDPA